ncbi:protein-arginine deiminase family protein [Nonomuraea typhae]|uniref:Protein-arginine deiminase family protein n=1 Tax=Nonomuraea typhae TaxID=2603600 RepID=A0ABW7YSY4_9ACTN
MSTLPPDKATLHVDFTQVGEVPVTYETWGRRGGPPGVLVMPGLRAQQAVRGLARLKIRRVSANDDLVLRLEPQPKDVSIMTSTATGWKATADPAADTTLVVEAAAYAEGQSTFRAVLEERDGSGRGDSALFSVAPFLLLPNDCPVEKIYVWYKHALNHPTVVELAEVLRELLGAQHVTLDPKTTPITPGDYGKLEVIDASHFPDNSWVQDYCEIGYRWTGDGRSEHLAVVTPNDGTLSDAVRRAMSSDRLKVLEVTNQPLEDSTDFGGNVECFPAVGKETRRMPSGPAGPEIEEHPPAPYGKILLGESEFHLFTLPKDRAAALNRGRLSHELWLDFSQRLYTLGQAEIRREGAGRWLVTDSWGNDRRRQFLITETADGLDVFFVRSVEAEYRRFLAAQAVQPILSVDTSWLSVGHVDEIISVVPGRRLLVASSSLAVELLTDVRERKFTATRMFRGRQVNALGAQYQNGLTVDQALAEHGSFNTETIQALHLDPIEERLKAGLDLQDEALIRLPVLYASVLVPPGQRLGAILEPPDALRTTALSTSLVNVLVVGEHILMPRPHGPRLSRDDVKTILRFRPPAHLLEQWHWEKAGTTAGTLAERFELAPGAILAVNPDAFADGTTRQPWTRIRIPEQNVDLFEAYVAREFEKAELTVHFVDTWVYHQLLGELHCATNVRRTPPDTTPAGWGTLS